MGYVYIAGTIAFTVYGQLILKWQVGKAGQLPAAFLDKLQYLFWLTLSPWVVTGLVAGFIASWFWMAALSKFELSFAYPFMSASFVCVLILSALLFGEAINLPKVLGLLFIIAGIIISARA
jgi:multidrug transporter EmrE-like cation transporter